MLVALGVFLMWLDVWLFLLPCVDSHIFCMLCGVFVFVCCMCVVSFSFRLFVLICDPVVAMCI